MKILALFITRQVAGSQSVVLDGAYDLSSFGYFQREGAKQMCNFCARTLTDRTTPGSKLIIKVQGM